MAEVTARGSAVTIPHKDAPPHKVYADSPLPCFVILVHGVNDAGEAYDAQERGLCAGFNERLSRLNWDLQPGKYKIPSVDDKLEPNPDAVYFRRQPDAGSAYSPVIPFYWGFREDDGMDKKMRRYIQKDCWHGEWLDRDGNRLDKDGAKNGGPFANATTNLADMWAAGWNSFKGAVNQAKKLTDDPDPLHPLLDAPHRRYMVLAALRLAMLIRIIRKRYPQAAVNLVAHSQGCLVSLLANALLLEKGDAPTDGLVMNNPPYSVEEPWEEGLHQGARQQTSRARIETLKAIVPKIHEKRAASPSLTELKDPKQHKGMVGKDWGRKQNPSTQAIEPFTERDNRGKVNLYFSPEDGTVAMVGVMGIGWQGVPDAMKVLTGSGHTLVTVLDGLGPGFRQRVFTEVLRNKERVQVGLPPHAFLFRQEGDEVKSGFVQHTPDAGRVLRITGEPLSPPVWADLQAGQRSPGRQGVSPIEASVAITDGGIQSLMEVVDDPRPPAERKPLTVEKRVGLALTKEKLTDVDELERLKGLVLRDWKRRMQPLNDAEGKARKVWQVFEDAGPGKLRVHRTETPDEARQRWQRSTAADSYHSAIVGNPNHSRYVTTYDLALGAPIPATEEDAKFRLYLCEVADWRRAKPVVSMLNADPEGKTVLGFFRNEAGEDKALIEAIGHYYDKGVIPPQVLKTAIPKLVVQETADERSRKGEKEKMRQAGEEYFKAMEFNRKLLGGPQ